MKGSQLRQRATVATTTTTPTFYTAKCCRFSSSFVFSVVIALYFVASWLPAFVWFQRVSSPRSPALGLHPTLAVPQNNPQHLPLQQQQNQQQQPQTAKDIKKATQKLLLSIIEKRLPPWMKQYFVWHHQERKRAAALAVSNNNNNNNGTNNQPVRYLIVACLRDDGKCGGTADRLKPIPFFVRLAAETNRLLLIYWNRPIALENFLLPPEAAAEAAVGGIDWRLSSLPQPLQSQLLEQLETTFPIFSVQDLIMAARKDSVQLIRSRIQSQDHGSTYYNQQAAAAAAEKEAHTPDVQSQAAADNAFRQEYFACWYSLFTPHPDHVASRVEQQLRTLRLQPGNYMSVHVRVNYGLERELYTTIQNQNQQDHLQQQEQEQQKFLGKERDHVLIAKWTRNAINCASSIRPGGPYFVSSDSDYAKEVARQYGTEKNVPIVASSSSSSRRTSADYKIPPHMDFAVVQTESQLPSSSSAATTTLNSSAAAAAFEVEEFYSVFVDLYLLSLGRCLSYNVGGYGKWAQVLSPFVEDFKCNVRHWTYGVGKNTADKKGCPWNNGNNNNNNSTTQTTTTTMNQQQQQEFFLFQAWLLGDDKNGTTLFLPSMMTTDLHS